MCDDADAAVELAGDEVITVRVEVDVCPLGSVDINVAVLVEKV